MLRFALEGRAGLRNKSFQFVCRDSFAGALRSGLEIRLDDVREVVFGFLGTDNAKKTPRKPH